MCLVAFALGMTEDLPLVVIANRDEFHTRAALPVSFWPEAPDVLAGRDLVGSGTWMGLTRNGRFAALTNVRDPRRNRAGARSRGELVASFLAGAEPPREFLEGVARRAGDYNPFNLLVGLLSRDAPELFAFGTERPGVEVLSPGVHGLSNHALDTPWPKVVRAREALRARVCGSPLEGEEEDLLAVLYDRSRPPDDELPDTGVGLEVERMLSSIFIDTPAYGTRSSTALVVRSGGRVRLTEVTHEPSRPSVSRVFVELQLP